MLVFISNWLKFISIENVEFGSCSCPDRNATSPTSSTRMLQLFAFRVHFLLFASCAYFHLLQQRRPESNSQKLENYNLFTIYLATLCALSLLTKGFAFIFIPVHNTLVKPLQMTVTSKAKSTKIELADSLSWKALRKSLRPNFICSCIVSIFRFYLELYRLTLSNGNCQSPWHVDSYVSTVYI